MLKTIPQIKLPRLAGMVATGILLTMATPLSAGVTTQTVSFNSDALGTRTTYIAALPSPLEPGKKYPVLYLLHGATGSYRDWTEKTTFTALLNNRDMIVITPDGGKFGWYLDSKIKPESQYETAITQDLLRDVETRFPVIKNRGGRGIAGLSMGGHGAVSLAAKHPDLFSSASSMSGILDITAHPTNWGLNDILGSQTETMDQWKQNSALFLADKFSTANVALLFDTGVRDKTGAVKDNRRMHKALSERNIEHIYHEFPGAHNWQYWSTHISEHLDFHEQNFQNRTSEKELHRGYSNKPINPM